MEPMNLSIVIYKQVAPMEPGYFSEFNFYFSELDSIDNLRTFIFRANAL